MSLSARPLSLRQRLGPFPNELDAVRSLHRQTVIGTPDDQEYTVCPTCYIRNEEWPCEVASLIEVLDAQIAAEEAEWRRTPNGDRRSRIDPHIPRTPAQPLRPVEPPPSRYARGASVGTVTTDYDAARQRLADALAGMTPNVHVGVLPPGHAPSSGCWCRPVRSSSDTAGVVVIHRLERAAIPFPSHLEEVLAP